MKSCVLCFNSIEFASCAKTSEIWKLVFTWLDWKIAVWGDDVVTNFLQFYSLCSPKESVSTGKWPTLSRWWSTSNTYLCLGLLAGKEAIKILFFLNWWNNPLSCVQSVACNMPISLVYLRFLLAANGNTDIADNMLMFIKVEF